MELDEKRSRVRSDIEAIGITTDGAPYQLAQLGVVRWFRWVAVIGRRAGSRTPQNITEGTTRFNSDKGHMDATYAYYLKGVLRHASSDTYLAPALTASLPSVSGWCPAGIT